MIKFGNVENVEDAARTAGLRIHASHNNLGDSGLNDSAGTHLAWLKSYIESAIFKAPVANLFAGFIYSGNFCMGKSVFVCIASL